MPFFQQEIMEMAEAKGPLTEPEYLDALATSKSVSQQAIDALMAEHNLDALVVPTEGPAWMTDHINGDQFSGISSSAYAAISGYASITVPAGQVSGLPIGVSFVGEAFSDDRLIRVCLCVRAGNQCAPPATARLRSKLIHQEVSGGIHIGTSVLGLMMGSVFWQSLGIDLSMAFGPPVAILCD